VQECGTAHLPTSYDAHNDCHQYDGDHPECEECSREDFAVVASGLPCVVRETLIAEPRA
jgi:hypothetical protein